MQLPDLVDLSKSVLADGVTSHQATLDAIVESPAAFYEAAAEERAMIRAALEKDPTNEALWRRLEQLTDLEAEQGREVRESVERINENRVIETVTVLAILSGVAFLGLASGGRPAAGIGRVVSAVRAAA